MRLRRRAASCRGAALACFAILGVAVVPCAVSAQTFDNEAAYRELLTKADPSEVVEHEGKRYIRAPGRGAKLPGGYSGAFETRLLTMPNGFVTEIIDPTKPIRIIAGKPQETLQVPERVARIVAALDRLGLRPKAHALPEAIQGYLILGAAGKQAPGETHFQIWTHVGEPSKVSVLARQMDKDIETSGHSREEAEIRRCPGGWSGYVVSYRLKPGQHSTYPVINQQQPEKSAYYADAATSATCYRDDVSLTIFGDRLDSRAATWTSCAPCTSESQATNEYIMRRNVELYGSAQPQVENWLKVLAQEIDKIDPRPNTPATAAQPPVSAKPEKPPEPKPPPVPEPKPSPSPPSKQTGYIAAAQQVMNASPPRTLIGPRIERWINEQADWAAQNPVKATGTGMMASGVALTAGAAVGAIASIWAAPGVALAVGGYYAYQSLKPKPPPAELEAVRDAREKLKKFQEDRKYGYSDAELNELGIVLDDLSKLTPEQRRQVYADSDIEFKRRAEVLRDMREHFAREESAK